MRLTSKKTKFGRNATKYKDSSCESSEEMDLKAILIGIFLVSLKCYIISLTLQYFFK